MVRWSLTFLVERPAVIRSRWILVDDVEEGTVASQRLAWGAIFRPTIWKTH